MTALFATTRGGRARQTWIYSVGILVAVIVVWLVLTFLLRGKHLVPGPAELAGGFAADGSLLLSNLGPTLAVAAEGFLLGIVLVVPLAAISVLSPALEPIVVRIAVAVHVIPFVAIAPAT